MRLIAEQKRAVAAADCGDGGDVCTRAVIVRACEEHGVRPAAAERGFDGLRRDDAAKRGARRKFRVDEITIMPGERHARDGGLVAIPREEHALVFAEGEQHRKDPGRGAAHEQEAVPRAVGLCISAFGCENRAFRRMQVVCAGDFGHVPGASGAPRGPSGCGPCGRAYGSAPCFRRRNPR